MGLEKISFLLISFDNERKINNKTRQSNGLRFINRLTP